MPQGLPHKLSSLVWQIILSVILVAIAIGLYVIHYMAFEDMHHILIYGLGDLAFVPIEVVIIYIVLNRVLKGRGETLARERLNSLMGIFFNELGRDLIFFLSKYDMKHHETSHFLNVKEEWTRKDFNKKIRQFNAFYSADIAKDEIDYEKLAAFLVPKKEQIVKLFSSAGTFESGSITFAFHSVLNLIEALERQQKKGDFSHMHMSVGLNKLYTVLVYQWLNYMRYINHNYPEYFVGILKSIDDVDQSFAQ